jgi:outer membrane cobalamin receptor
MKRQGDASRFAALLCLLLHFPLTVAQGFADSTEVQTKDLEPEEFGSLNIEQLSRVQIVSATLIPTRTRLVPAKTTVVDRDTITQSGARNLNELLENYTPNALLMAHNTHQDHFGIRGIISDRDDT